ncbi:hypothetical protein Acr_06g0014250 [Actinidia rufa]|uniref:Uncharacterized protein n=1 Tax=Actinidia rufa TaxID=165716 RepID=A0A7J0ESN5_9ERIC|nr:hypothetical protein Acr_06g0014250 [Actinidia rufa]
MQRIAIRRTLAASSFKGSEMALHLAAHPLDYVLVLFKLQVDRPFLGHQKAVFAEEAEDREKQLTEAVKEDCIEVSDGGSLLLYCQEWGLYELRHELICSSLWPIN